MQESLFNTVQKLKSEQRVNIEELEVILNSDIEEVVSLCKKACLKPKTDPLGSAYFTMEDVNLLKKMKELYDESRSIHAQESIVQKSVIEEAPKEEPINLNKKINFLQKAKQRVKIDPPSSVVNYSNNQSAMIQSNFKQLQDTLINKMSELLSEKMDGFDEIIVELIRSKTDNENLRQQINSLNKQIYILKNELASYQPIPLGLYIKKDIEEL